MIPANVSVLKYCIIFRIIGEVLHARRSAKQVKFRRLNLEERDEANREMRNIDPSKYSNKLFTDADLSALRMGNYNVAKTLPVRSLIALSYC